MKIRLILGLTVLSITTTSCSIIPFMPDKSPESTVETTASGITGETAPTGLSTDTQDKDLALESLVAQCDFSRALEWMSSQDIGYTQDPGDEWRDCSGNFLRLSSRIASTCNNVQMVAPKGITRYEKGGNNKRPGMAHARTSEDIARWYDQKGLFIPIFYDATDISSAPESLEAVRNKIKPGSVLWFSREQPLSSEGDEGLLDSINHMGTIVSVTKDDDGNVIEWTMYHSYNETKNNDVTTHWWNWPKKYTSRGQEYPPGGFWDQRIVGMSETLLVPSTAVATSE